MSIVGAGANGSSMNPEPGSYQPERSRSRSRPCKCATLSKLAHPSPVAVVARFGTCHPVTLLHHATPTMRPNKTPAFMLTALYLMASCVSHAALEQSSNPAVIDGRVELGETSRDTAADETPRPLMHAQSSPCEEACSRITELGERDSGIGAPDGYQAECEQLCYEHATEEQLRCFDRARNYEDLGACATN